MSKNRNTALNKIENTLLKKIKIISLRLVVIGFAFIFTLFIYYTINMRKVSNDDAIKEVTINEGSIDSIATTLKEENLIRNITIFKVYTRISGRTNLKAGVYNFSENMDVKKIVKSLENGSSSNPNEISITFNEGINIRKIAKLIEENTSNSYDHAMEVINDSSYIDTLISKYWFLTDDIKNTNIYYPLEGYLAPNTYRFSSKDVEVKEIVEKMLDQMDKELNKYKKSMENSDLSIHELLTLASIVELEGGKTKDREAVAGVFYNRLNSSSYGILGSDVTTYYGSKIDDWTYSLTYKELDDCTNKYNTRCPSNSGLPVGPVCNPSLDSIKATINPEKNDYYYFVADCQGNIYMSKTDTEHNNTINKLIRENNWCA